MSKRSRRDRSDKDKWTEAERQAEHRIRMRFEYRDLIEELIQEGQERGVFDNLPGAGRPLDLESNVYEADRKLANALMKEHQLLPAWLATRNSILEEVEALRSDIGRRWEQHDQAYRLVRDDGRRMALSLSWRNRCAEWEETVASINKGIDEYNLRRPSEQLELFKLRLASELQRAGARRNLGETSSAR